MVAITLILAVVAMALFYYYCIKPMSYWKDRGVKQTKAMWFFGDMFKTTFRLITFSEWISTLYNTYPGSRYLGFYQYTTATLLIKDPDLIKQVTVKDFEHFGDHRSFLTENADPLWANNLFALKGQKWREMRSLLSPFFTSSKMRNMFILMTECAEKFTGYFLEKKGDIVEVELRDIFTRFTNDVIATTAFGVETDSLREQSNDFYLMGKEATTFTGFKKAAKLLAMTISPKLSEIFNFQFFAPEVRDFFYDLVNQTIRAREEKNIIRPDMIHLLTQSRKGNVKPDNETEIAETGFSTVQEVIKGKVSNIKLTNEQIASQAMLFFFGGFDSISNLMCFLAYELAVNPDVQQRLRDEIEETLAENNGKLTYEALTKMKYMDMVVSETLRKWPVGGVDRECTSRYKIEPVTPDEKPVYVEKGDQLWIPIFSIHRDEKYYPDPERFDPERFNEENKKHINPLTYIPFGAGPRNCIGSRFALLENKALIFHILHHFEIVPTKRSKVPIELGNDIFQIKPKGLLWFGLKRLRSN